MRNEGVGLGLRARAWAIVLAVGAGACAPEGEMVVDGVEAAAGAELVVLDTWWANDIAMVPVREGRHFLGVALELTNPDPGSMPLPAIFTSYTVSTEGGLRIAASVASELTESPCGADISVQPGGEFHCDIAFEIPEDEVPVTLHYDALDERTAEVPLEPDACTWCGDACVDLASSAGHCGACNDGVAAGFQCVDGVPLCVDEALTDCDGTCVDTQTDPSHCGACDNAITQGQGCVDGTPVDCPSSSELANCDGTCINLQKDILNCGACDRTCPWSDRPDVVVVDCLDGDGCRWALSDAYKQSCDELCASDGGTCVSARYLYGPPNCSLEIGCGDPPDTHPECGGPYDGRECSCTLTW